MFLKFVFDLVGQQAFINLELTKLFFFLIYHGTKVNSTYVTNLKI